jgi:signal transduction histidine kinase
MTMDETLHGVRQLGERLWRLAQRYWFDAVILAALGIALASAVARQHHKDGPQGPLWFDVLAVVAFTTPLFARRRFPVGSLLAVGIVIGSSTFVDGRLISDDFVTFLIGIALVVLFGMRPARWQSLAGLAFVIGVGVLVVVNDPIGHNGDFAWNTMIFSIAWIVGFAIGGKLRETDEAKERATRAEREREEQARLAVSDERARIARELHDVVGHSVSVMTVQASAVRRLLSPDQEKQREALLVVEQTGREALAEMRRMVGVLRRPEEAPALAPQPSLEHLNKLVDHAREAGLPVELRIEGEPEPLPAGVDLTAYRLVQEGLTNALKHARAQHAEVLIRYSDGQVELTVSDDGPGGGDGEKGGHGLVGMRERVSVYGGELETGPRPEGGYRLRARLPIA